MQRRSSQPLGGRSPGEGGEPGADPETEAYSTLLARAHRRTGGVPPEAVVRHVLVVTRGGDWPVQRDALEAVLRRCTSVHTDGIRIVKRPRGLASIVEWVDDLALEPKWRLAPWHTTPVEVTFERSGSFLSRLERIVTPATTFAPPDAADGSAPDDEATEREVDVVIAAGDESRDGSGTSTPGLEPAPSAAEIQRLVSALTVQRTASGGLVIAAPPETASTLAALFAGMAQLLVQAASAPPPASGGRSEAATREG